MCLAGILSALVFVVTAYLHIPTYNGYVHFGDGFIFLAACILPMPYSILIGATGAMLFCSKGARIITLRNVLMLIPAALISVAGYYFYEVLITGSFVASLAGIPGSFGQAIASSIVFVAAGLALDKLNMKKKLTELCL